MNREEARHDFFTTRDQADRLLKEHPLVLPNDSLEFVDTTANNIIEMMQNVRLWVAEEKAVQRARKEKDDDT